jgi:hypothetical protein
VRLRAGDRSLAGSAAILASVAGFVVFELAAMLFYPGGTWWDTGARGASFWLNFLCDLERRVALDGQPNLLGSRLAQAAVLILSLGLAPFWIAVARLLHERAGLAQTVRTLGLLGTAGNVAVTLMPSDRFGAIHGATVLIAGVPGLTAVLLAVVGLAVAGPRPRVEGWIGASMLGFASVNFVLYAMHYLGGVEGTPLVPVMQKMALICLLAWMIAVAFRLAKTIDSAPIARTGHRAGERVP